MFDLCEFAFTLKWLHFFPSLQHFQLALIDSKLCTLSKAESKYRCYNCSSQPVTRYNVKYDHIWWAVLLVVCNTYWKGIGIFLQSRFFFLSLCCCFPADSAQDWGCLGDSTRRESELEVLSSTLQIHTVISDYMYTLGKVSYSPSHLCSIVLAVCTHWASWSHYLA